MDIPVQAGLRDRPARVRLAREAAASFQFIWRTLRRLGVRPDQVVDDAVQRVFEIALRKSESIAPGMERAFLFKVAVLVAAEERRGARQQHERVQPFDEERQRLADEHPGPEELLAERRRRQILDEILDALPLELRTVFVLFEIEGMPSYGIAELLSIPVGTAASRLRRAREQFEAQARRVRARLASSGGGP